jgi:hypothetical protein
LLVDALKVEARSSRVIALGCMIEGTDNSSMNTLGGTFTLSEFFDIID